MIATVLLSVSAVVSLADTVGNGLDGAFRAWKSEFRKVYANVEDEAAALSAFVANEAIIVAHNAKQLSYTLGHNEFSDLTSEQFYSQYITSLNLNRAPNNMERDFIPMNASIPDSVDWVAKGAVTPIKNQGRCGSCWAFSTTGSVEGAFQVSSGKLVSLSEEDLVQCSHNGNQGCQGGLMDNAFQWIEQNGIATEADYPYTSGSGTTGSCDASKKAKPAVTITGFTDVPKDDEDALKAAVAAQPVSVAIEADKSVFQLYKSGVFDNQACGTHLDHGVLAVGYGSDSDSGKDFWKVKNSWGETWGEQGFIRMVRGKNMCGIATQASYPTGAKAAGPSPPSPGPSPPSPTPPGPSPKTHYGNPKDGCLSDETELQLGGITGKVCASKCGLFKTCPSDVPSGVQAPPTCLVSKVDPKIPIIHKQKYCTLNCLVGDGSCGDSMTCVSLGLPGAGAAAGFCAYVA